MYKRSWLASMLALAGVSLFHGSTPKQPSIVDGTFPYVKSITKKTKLQKRSVAMKGIALILEK